MRLHTYHELLPKVAARWDAQYRNSTDPGKQEIGRQLFALKRPGKRSIEKIIGNKSWTNGWCCGCHDYVGRWLELNEQSDLSICEKCARIAWELLK